MAYYHTYLSISKVLRSLGPANSNEILGGGFIQKNTKDGWTADLINTVFPFYSLVYVLEGEGYYSHKGLDPIPLTAGALFFRYPHREHTTTVKKNMPWTELFIDFGPHMAKTFSSIGLIDIKHPVSNPGVDANLVAQAGSLFTRLKESPQQHVLSLFPEFISLHQSLLERGHKTKHPDGIVEKACSELAKNIDSRFDIRLFCAQHGWGYEKFRKLFSLKMGISPHQYRIRLRMDKACSYLVSRLDLSIAEIASHLGYSNAHEFSAQFKKRFSTSPLNYRKFHRTDAIY